MTRQKARRAGPKAQAKTNPPERLHLMMESIGVVGITEHGEHVGMELRFGTGESATVLFPTPYYQKLMAALMSADAAAQKGAPSLARISAAGSGSYWSGAFRPDRLGI